jgi:hypothetical protein
MTRNAPPLQPSLTDVAYAAGVVDGEGCIHVAKTRQRGRPNPTYRLALSITQNHLGLLERVARTLQVPRRIYPLKRTTKTNRDVYSLQISDQHAYAALQTLLPHLLRKRPEAEVGIEVYERGRMRVHPGASGHPPEIWDIREKAYRKLQRMK